MQPALGKAHAPARPPLGPGGVWCACLKGRGNKVPVGGEEQPPSPKAPPKFCPLNGILVLGAPALPSHVPGPPLLPSSAFLSQDS